MDRRSLRNLDLNLLTALEALLEERNVTRAAERVGLSQPAVSSSLQRLRRHFNDDLLARTGNRYELTPLAKQLREPTIAALSGLQRVFDATPDFDPATAEREFTVIVSDYAATVLGDHLATVMEAQAPGARLRLATQTHAHVDEAPESLRQVDGMVLPHGFLSGIPSTDLYEDDWVLVASRDHPDLGDAVELEQLKDLPWVVTHHAPTAYTPAARQLSLIGIEPDLRIVVESFLAVPFLVTGTRRIALLQRQLADRLSDAAGVQVLPCPWDVVPLIEAFWWHPAHQADPAHAWLRSTIRQAARRAAAGPSGIDSEHSTS